MRGYKAPHWSASNIPYPKIDYPDKYYIYKYELFKAAATELTADYMPKRNGSVDSLIGGFQMYDEICKVVASDESLKEMIQKALTPSCYPDPEMRTATIDVGFYLARFYLEERKSEQEEAEWFPKDYSPNLTVDDWIDLLEDSSVFTQGSLQIMKRMKDYGGAATCKQLSVKYGENPNFYNGGSWSLAQRIAKKTGCPVMTKDTDNSKWWPILYRGRKSDKATDGAYIWKLRDELSEALDKVNLDDVELYAKGEEKTDEPITPDCMFNMGGNQIGAKTLDLNVDFKVIAAQLDKIAEDFFQVRAA